MPGVLIVRLDAQLYYANALTVRDQIMQYIADADEPVRAVVIDAVAQDSLDITSSNMFKSLVGRLRDRGIELYFAEVHQPLIEFAAETHLLELIGEDHVFETIDAAVHHLEDRPAAGETTTTP